VASSMLFGSATPSSLPSRPTTAHVDGMNCMGPTARSHVVFPSHRPWSVSWMAAVPFEPSSSGPKMGVTVLPFESSWPPSACSDSIRPIPASSCQWRWQVRSVRESAPAASLYAARTRAGIGEPHGAKAAEATCVACRGEAGVAGPCTAKGTGTEGDAQCLGPPPSAPACTSVESTSNEEAARCLADPVPPYDP